MKKRLYFMLPNILSARNMLDELLLSRIEERHIHFLAKRGTLPPDLPEANLLQKTDIVHGAEIGLVSGGAVGTAAGILIVLAPLGDMTFGIATVLVTAVFGGFFGTWVSSMIGSQVPNSRLKAFHEGMERGSVLMMVDVPFSRIQMVREAVMKRHPEIISGGVEPTIPAFP